MNNFNTSKINWIFFFLVLFGFFSAALPGAEEKSRYVLVSVAPYKFLVEKIAGNTVKVGLMVPAGASSHTYEPTPREMIAASHADAWFLIGEGFEKRASLAIQSHHPQIRLIDIRQGVHLISDDAHTCHSHHHHCCSNPNCQDLHIWLSPKQTAIQVETLAAALQELYPENKNLYEENLQKLLSQLNQLDLDIDEILTPLANRWMMVSHPAYAYFARDYHLKQLSIEFEGKDPTPKQLTQVISTARQNKIKTIFIQPQYNNKGARLIAKTIGAKVVNLDPYSEDYFNSMREIANQVALQ